MRIAVRTFYGLHRKRTSERRCLGANLTWVFSVKHVQRFYNSISCMDIQMSYYTCMASINSSMCLTFLLALKAIPGVASDLAMRLHRHYTAMFWKRCAVSSHCRSCEVIC